LNRAIPKDKETEKSNVSKGGERQLSNQSSSEMGFLVSKGGRII
jgi:hypothetical protein